MVSELVPNAFLLEVVVVLAVSRVRSSQYMLPLTIGDGGAADDPAFLPIDRKGEGRFRRQA